MEGGRFFGAFRACSGITDAVVLNHVPVGCNWGVGMFNNISSQPDIRHACTVVHEREIVFGGEEALKRALRLADKTYDAPLLVVISGDVPSIIGDDIQSVIDSLSLKKDVLWMEAAGYKGSMRDGYEDALAKLGSLMKERDVKKRSINLIGLCPDDFKVHADLKEIKRIIEALGISVNSTISMCSLEEFCAAPAAELNVVMGQGAKLAKYMKNEFGVPYIEVDYPYGLEGSMKFAEALCGNLDVEDSGEKCLDLEPFERTYLYLHEMYGTSVSVTGDFRCNPMADFLERELGFEIEVKSCSEEDRSSFEENVRSSNTMMLFGSSFERGLARDLGIPLMRFVYPVFDQVCMCDYAPYAGFRGAVYLTESIINSVMGFDGKSR
mgnify:FL=1